MVNALIADCNLYFIKEIINAAINETIDVKIEYISTNAKETLEILLQKQFDLIFLNQKLLEINERKILARINFLNTIKQPKIIIMSEENDVDYELKNSKYISNIIYKSDTKEQLLNKIKLVTDDINYKTNITETKTKVLSEINNLGYNIKLVGTKYLYEAIMYIYESNNFALMDNLEQNVYKVLACKYNKSIINIKTNIAKSTRAMYGEDNRFTPKYVISNILTKVC